MPIIVTRGGVAAFSLVALLASGCRVGYLALPLADAGSDAGWTDGGTDGQTLPDAGTDDGTDAGSDVGDGDGGPEPENWSLLLGGTQNDRILVVDVDDQGNVYFAGDAAGEIDLGDGPVQGEGDFNAFLASYSRQGTYRWATLYNGPGSSTVYGISVGPGGAPYTCGYLAGQAQVGGVFLDSGWGSDVLVAGFSSEGVPGIARLYGTVDGNNAQGFGIDLDDQGRMVFGGFFASTLVLDPSPEGQLGPAVLDDGFLAAFESDGSFGSARRLTGDGDATVVPVRFGAGDNLCLGGRFSGTLETGTGSFSCMGQTDAFVASHNLIGGPGFTLVFGTAGIDEVDAVAAHPSGGCLMAGTVGGDLIVGGSEYPGHGGTDVLTAWIDPVTQARWVTTFGGSGDEYGRGMVMGDGQIFVTGVFSGTVDFGPTQLDAQGEYDTFVAALDIQTGQVDWAVRLGGPGAVSASDIARDPQTGELTVVGHYHGQIDLPGGTSHDAGDQEDMFLHHFSPP